MTTHAAYDERQRKFISEVEGLFLPYVSVMYEQGEDMARLIEAMVQTPERRAEFARANPELAKAVEAMDLKSRARFAQHLPLAHAVVRTALAMIEMYPDLAALRDQAPKKPARKRKAPEK